MGLNEVAALVLMMAAVILLGAPEFPAGSSKVMVDFGPLGRAYLKAHEARLLGVLALLAAAACVIRF